MDLSSEISDLEYICRNYSMRPTTDPLGFGLQWWKLQFLEAQASKKYHSRLLSISDSALDIRHFVLPFRLYGALLGAQLSGDNDLERKATSLIFSKLLDKEPSRNQGHSSINAVMYATLFYPGAFRRKADEESFVS